MISERSHQRWLALLAGVWAAVVVGRPLAAGAELRAVLAFWAVTAALVVLPGLCLLRLARLDTGLSLLTRLGQGGSLGLAFHGLSLLAAKALGLDWLSVAIPLSAVLVALPALVRRRREGTQVHPKGSGKSDITLLLVLLVGTLLQPLCTARALGHQPLPVDLLFHAGNAAELRHRWPLENPRIAGLPLNYHVLSYALPVDASRFSGTPVATNLLALAPLLWVSLLGLQLGAAGRALLGTPAPAALAAALVLCHADPGDVLGLGSGAFLSYLGSGVYGSPTTVCGLILLCGAAASLADWLTLGWRRRLPLAAVLTAAGTAAKASVLPPLLGGLALTAAWALARGRHGDARRAGLALAVVAAAGLPFLLWYTLGTGSYGPGLSWEPGAVYLKAPVRDVFVRSLGAGAGTVVGAGIWLLGFLGPAAPGAIAWLALRDRPTEARELFAGGIVGVGLALALAVGSPGLWQLFFADNAQILLAVFGAAGMLHAARLPALRRTLLLGVFALMAVPSLHWLVRSLRGAMVSDVANAGRQPDALVSDYLRGLAWLRANAATDAVVLADNPTLVLSAFGEVRLLHETALYSPGWWAQQPQGLREPYPERTAAQQRLLRAPDAAAANAVRALVGGGRRLLVVADSTYARAISGLLLVEPGAVPPRPVFQPPAFQSLFANGAMQVFEVRPETRP